MALQNTDNFLVNRSGTAYKVPFSELDANAQTAISNAATAQSTADGAETTANAALPKAGGQMTGALTTTERTITAGAFDLSTGNSWTCGAIAVPNPTNGVAGQTGVIRVTAAPTGWGSNFKFPGGTAIAPTAFPAMVPFYVQDASTILVGTAIEGIA